MTIKALFIVFLMWITRDCHTDDYDILIDDYERAKELGLL